MAKFKITNKKDQLTTTITRSTIGKMEVNERELLIFEKNLLPGFFHPKVEGKHKIIYTAPKSIPLSEYMEKNLTIHKFYNILAQIVEIVKRTDEYKLYVYNLVLDKRLIFVKETTSELYFLYEPLLDRNNCTNLFSFLEDFVRNLKPEDKTAEFEKQRFLIFLRNPQIHRIEDVEQFIVQAYPQIYQQINRSNQGKSGFITSSPVSTMQHYQTVEDSLDSQSEGETTLLTEEGEETALLEEEGTALLDSGRPEASLLRCSTGITTNIAKDVFTIGKAAENDLCIADNKTISRNHARILCSGNGFTLQDMNSTNHTCVNGRRLEGGKEELLQNGDRIQLSNEEFEFYLQI